MEYESIEKVRRFSFGAFLALIVAFLVVAFVLDIEQFITRDQEAFTLEGTYIRIIKKQQTKWEVWADEITVGKDGKQHDLENIYRGIFYRKEKPPFIFSASHGTYNSETEEVVIEGDIRFDSENGEYFRSQRIEWYGKPDELYIPTPLEANLDGNTYSAQEMTATGEDLENMVLKRDVVVEVPDISESGSDETREEIDESGVDEKYIRRLVLRADRVEYSEKTKFMQCFPESDWKIIHMPGEIMPYENNPKVTLTGDKVYIESYEMYMHFDRKYARAVGDAFIIKKGEPQKDTPDSEERAGRKKLSRALKKRDTNIETEEVFYYWKKGHVQVPGPMRMYQENLDLDSGKAFLDTKNDTAFLSGGVRLHQEKGTWLEDEGVIGEDASDKTREVASQDTVVTSRTMEMNFETEDLMAAGDVVVEQEDRKLLGSKAVYLGDESEWTVTGGPVAIEDDRKITADVFKYNEDEEEFRALGGAYVEMELDEEDTAEADALYAERGGGAQAAAGAAGPGEKRARVFSGDIRYDRKNDIAYGTGRTRVLYRDIELEADRMTVDYASDTATGTGNVVLRDPETVIVSDTVFADNGGKFAVFTGSVLMNDRGAEETMEEKGREPFELEAARLRYDWSRKTGYAEKGPERRVRLRATGGGPARWSVADRLELDRAAGEYVFTGDVLFHQDSGGWLDEYDWFEDTDEDARKIAAKPTDITCDKATINREAETVRFEKDVVVKQPVKQLRADTLEVDTRAKRLVAEGNVYLSQSRGQWLFDEGFITEETEEEAKKKLKNAIEVTAGRLESLYGKDEKKLLLEGNVRIVQGGALATADRMWHYGISKKTILEGNVKYKDEKGRTLDAGRVVYDSGEKTLEAFDIRHGESDVGKARQ